MTISERLDVPYPLTRRQEGLAELDGVPFYVIPDVGSLEPFLMSLVSDSDHWCFVSSAGPLAAGRRDADHALFPYETDDRLHVATGVVGPATVVRVGDGAAGGVWEPFGRCPTHGVARALAKSVLGDLLVFEELHEELGLLMRFRWATSERFGFVRQVELLNVGDEAQQIRVADGIVGVLPHGLVPNQYRNMSNLTNAYRRSEILGGPADLAVHTLEALIVDQAKPAESLHATVTWSTGSGSLDATVDHRALDAARSGQPAEAVTTVRGRPGAHLVLWEGTLDAGAAQSWYVVADVAKDHAAVAELRAFLAGEPDLPTEIEASIRRSSGSLARKLASADALQETGDAGAAAHHTANVLFNIMRGGVFRDGYRCTTADFERFLVERNRHVAAAHAAMLDELPPEIDHRDLVARAISTGDPDLARLALEYLPLTFSRRHGDPSRPWNRFSIRVQEPDGTPVMRHEGNWRDIFQNWEALCISFPDYLLSVIAVFVNASTADGFNPYRITRAGFEWEIPDPDDPWSNIGYWGDHQIVYLYRLLEAADRMLPGGVDALLDQPLFTYADVPYRLRSYDELVTDPRASIRYDESAAEEALARTEAVGGDGKLLVGSDGSIWRATLLEKLLVPVLSKLSSYVPDGGIWMNTQRPEWNDANNALAGYGLSMVTLYHLRRYLAWLVDLTRRYDGTPVPVSTEVAVWLRSITSVLAEHADVAETEVGDERRAAITTQLGRAFESYRQAIYEGGFSGTTDVSPAAIIDLCLAALEHIDAAVRRNRRDDGLYHAYNLIRFDSGGTRASIERLTEMLEGQVAALSCGILDASECADVIDALYTSALYRSDQDSFILYPNDPPSPFMAKNVIPEPLVRSNPLFAELIASGDQRLVTVDVDGHHHFNGHLQNAADVDAVLDRLAAQPPFAALVESHRAEALDTYETVFNHHAFTGRSGTMYAYEGLGSIYWHMVAKLLVAVQECLLAAHRAGDDPAVIDRLRQSYFRIRSGLGFNKSASHYGAFPIDPYSHTPPGAGAQQPGMTGQVKEEILTRLNEVGILIDDGEICFDPLLVRRSEFLAQPADWQTFDLTGRLRVRQLDSDTYGFTLCQVPFVVTVDDCEPHMVVRAADGTEQRVDGARLGPEVSGSIFSRDGAVAGVGIFVPPSMLEV